MCLSNWTVRPCAALHTDCRYSRTAPAEYKTSVRPCPYHFLSVHDAKVSLICGQLQAGRVIDTVDANLVEIARLAHVAAPQIHRWCR